MDAGEKKAFVIAQLKKYRKPEDIIYELCQMTGENWRDTEAFVRDVIHHSQDDIEAARQPLLLGIGLALTVVGFAATLVSLILTLTGWMVMIFYIPYSGNILIFLGGVAALIGGLRGLFNIHLNPDAEN